MKETYFTSPNANASPLTLLGNYAGPPYKLVTPLQAFQQYVKNTIYHPSCDGGVKCSLAQIGKVVEIATKVDYMVLMMGLDQSEEREDHDQVHLDLPSKQLELIHSVAKASKRPVILVIFSGGPLDISLAKYNNKVGGILWAGYPGDFGGISLAQIIFGDHNPDMRMRVDPSSRYPGRTYRFYRGPKVCEFEDNSHQISSRDGCKIVRKHVSVSDGGSKEPWKYGGEAFGVVIYKACKIEEWESDQTVGGL
ncbi:hypothetical protein K1719_008897 [Acacia pycnantha]|nr:hypothetical protein K1719_008897 [Acacia pycnantha]